MPPRAPAVEPYNLDPDFERACAALVCSNRLFFGSIADVLDPACLGAPEAKLLASAALAHFKLTGSGPSDPCIVLQRLRTLMGEGKVTVEQIAACDAYLERGEASAVGKAREECAAELGVLLRGRARMSALKVAAMASTRSIDSGTAFLEAFEAAKRAESIGTVDISVGASMGGILDAISDARDVEKLPTGVQELDSVFGGLGRGCFGYFLADPKVGKSLMLTQVTHTALSHGLSVAFATLEVSLAHSMARLVANMVDVQVDDVLAGNSNAVVVERMAQAALPGFLRARHFKRKVTGVDDILAWVRHCEQVDGRPVDLLVVDYADLVGSRRKEKDGSMYLSMEDVYGGFRAWAEELGRRCWSASQSKDTHGKKMLGIGDSADSRRKDQLTDVGVSINPRDDKAAVMFNVFANRLGGEGQSSVLPTEYAFGRVAPRVRRECEAWGRSALGGGA